PTLPRFSASWACVPAPRRLLLCKAWILKSRIPLWRGRWSDVGRSALSVGRAPFLLPGTQNPERLTLNPPAFSESSSAVTPVTPLAAGVCAGNRSPVRGLLLLPPGVGRR